MPLLHLIAGSARPLIRLETKFAIDGTGFGTSVHDCHATEKHGSNGVKRKTTPRHRWVEAKIVFGITTHMIAAVQITEPGVPACPLMPELAKAHHELRIVLPLRRVTARRTL